MPVVACRCMQHALPSAVSPAAPHLSQQPPHPVALPSETTDPDRSTGMHKGPPMGIEVWETFVFLKIILKCWTGAIEF